MRVAVIHDWLTGMRGGEAVLEGILDLFPDADLHALFHFPGSVSQQIESHTIHTSSLQRTAARVADYRHLLPLFPRAIREFDLSDYELVISSSHCVAKGVDAKGSPHLCYCHTPMRYIWDRFDDYFPKTKPLVRAAARVVAARLRKWDVETSAGVTRFVANSSFVRDRIARCYDRDADIVHPFVDDAYLVPDMEEDRGDEHVIVSALVPYKRIDLAVEAVAGSQRKLVVIGGGPLLGRFRRRAPSNVLFTGPVSRAEIIERVGRARSLILPGIEDFGITPLEAMALGTPVVALGAGGVLDSVVNGVTGIFFSVPVVHSLRQALDEVESRAWDRAAVREHARRFSRARFRQRFLASIQRLS